DGGAGGVALVTRVLIMGPRLPSRGRLPGSNRRPDAVAVAEVEARDGVEVGAGDADDPRVLRVRGRVDDARPVGTRFARTDAIALGGLEHRAGLALGLDAAPFGPLGERP